MQTSAVVMLRTALRGLLEATMYKDHPAESDRAQEALMATDYADEPETKLADPRAAPVIIENYKRLTYNQIDKDYEIYIGHQIARVFQAGIFDDPALSLFIKNIERGRDIRELMNNAVASIPDLTAQVYPPRNR